MYLTEGKEESSTANQTEDNQKDGGRRLHSREAKSVRILLTRLRDAENASERSLLCRDFAYDFARSFVALFLCGLFTLIAILEIVVGLVNLHSCPVNQMIPVWLVVSGSVSCLRYILAISAIIMGKHHSLFKIREVLECFISIFWFIWLILGSVWTYSVSDIVQYQPGTSVYCDHFTYVLTFTIITVIISLIILGLMCCCCLCCFFICLMPPPSQK